MPALSIVIPAYNEQARLPETLARVLSYLDKASWSGAEVLVVDDGSRDGTAALVEEWGSRDARVRLLRNPGNRGKGYSVKHGMMEARGEWVLFSDADLSAPIEELDVLWAAIERTPAGVAIGSRALNRGLIGVHQSKFRETAGRFFNLVMRLVCGLPFWDTQCGFKLFRRDAARDVFSRLRLERFGFDVEALFIARLKGYKTIEVPVRWNHADGTKVSMFRDSADMFLDLLRVRRNQLLGRYR
ncbi:MAG: glycosyltransferase family 2 protein [Bryobacterales bacterium]|nr:glycosyltransferase family 2 protein [Bryobacterales bacterium]